MRYRVIDDFEPDMCRAAAEEWPGESWPWLRYDTPEQRKRVAWNWQQMPPAVRALQARLLLVDAPNLLGLPSMYPAIPDSLLYGAGMCDMRAGDFLQTHLDHDRHALTGLHRVANAILFLSECEGGGLDLLTRNGWERIPPKPGRLVLFEATDQSYHGVSTVTGGVRMTLSTYWYGAAAGRECKRPKAKFIKEATCNQPA